MTTLTCPACGATRGYKGPEGGFNFTYLCANGHPFTDGGGVSEPELIPFDRRTWEAYRVPPEVLDRAEKA